MYLPVVTVRFAQEIVVVGGATGGEGAEGSSRRSSPSAATLGRLPRVVLAFFGAMDARVCDLEQTEARI